MRPVLIACALALGGCASFPDAGGAPIRASQLTPAGASSWTYDLGDPAFAAYLVRADIDSLDVKGALARARAADAGLRGAQAERWPELTLGVDGSRRMPAEGRSSGQADLDLGARWTADLWGAVRGGADAAHADAKAARLDVQAARAILAAEAARTWLILSAHDDRLARLDNRWRIEAEGLRLAERRLAAGRAGREEKLERQANLARIEDDRRAAEGERMVAMQRLVALAGTSSAPVGAAAALAGLKPLALFEVQPASLEARPDVAAAAARLAAADARRLTAIKEARPRLVLTAGFKSDGAEISDLFSRSRLVFTPGLRAEGALLDGGRARARADKAAAEAAQAEVGYLKAIVAAESELAAAFAQLQAAERRQAPSKAGLDYARERLAIARLRLQAGTLARLDAIDAERSVFEAEDAQAAARRSLIEASIATHAAIVGASALQAP